MTGLTRTYLPIGLLIYVVVASILGYAYRYGINPDGLAHLRLAGYIAEGKFSQSVSGSWSPMFSWLVAPFLIFGLKPLLAGRIVIALSGAFMLFGCWKLSERFDLPSNFRYLSIFIISILIAIWTVQFISADVLIASLYIFYFYFVTSDELLSNKKKVCMTGILAGLAYYAKNYMMPFFMIHFPVMLILHYLFFHKVKTGISLKRLVVSYLLGVVCFFTIASGWIFVLSSKYGELTLTGKSKIAYALMGPEDVRYPPLFYDGLNTHSNEYQLHIFEDHSVLQYKSWSPFENKRYFIHQLNLIRMNITYMLNHFVNQSPFFTYAFVVCVIFSIAISLFVTNWSLEKKYMYAWIIVTFAIYSSGYILLIARSPRRFYALMVIFVLTAGYSASLLINKLSEGLNRNKKNMLILIMCFIMVGAFSIKPSIILSQSLINIITKEQVNAYEDIADQVLKIDFPSPYAIVRSAQKPYTDFYIAFYLKKQFLGRPLSDDIDGITNELMQVNAKALLIFDNPLLVEKFKRDTRYQHIGEIKLRQDARYWNAVNIKQDQIKNWDKTVNIFIININSSRLTGDG